MVTLESDGLKVVLEVVGYKPNDTNWCRLDFHVYGDGIDLNYNSESMISLEVEELTHYLGKLLKGELTDRVNVNWMEPDYNFKLIPKHIWCRDCLEITCRLKQDRRGTKNSLIMTFYEVECKKLYEYLKNVIGVVAFPYPEEV